jgi:hypothetical protein
MKQLFPDIGLQVCNPERKESNKEVLKSLPFLCVIAFQTTEQERRIQVACVSISGETKVV